MIDSLHQYYVENFPLSEVYTVFRKLALGDWLSLSGRLSIIFYVKLNGHSSLVGLGYLFRLGLGFCPNRPH
jgi:hypothetical protein